jgi:ATP-dependent protease ClpP protease subunit
MRVAEMTAPEPPEIYMLVAAPRRVPKPLPSFPNPPCRPEGKLAPLVLNFVSDVPRGVDVALGRIPKRDSAAFVQAIRSAGNRSIHININCAGGEGEGALQIATALLQHEFAVHCRIIGRCSSGATFLALAADTRNIIESGHVLVHAACRLCTPTQYDAVQRLTAKDKQEIDDSLNDTDDAQVSLLQTRLGVSEATARQWLNEDRKWTAAEALECGFVHSIAADLELAS